MTDDGDKRRRAETQPGTPTDGTSDDMQPSLLFLSRFFRATRALQGAVGAELAEHHGIELREFMVLTSIRKGYSYPSAIARRLHASKFAISRIVQRLTELGLIHREIDADDSRKVRLGVTERGLEFRREVLGSVQSRMGPLLEALGEERLEQLADGLELVIEHLGARGGEEA